MISPTMMGGIGIFGTLAGGLMKAKGAEAEGRSSRDAYNYKAGMADINARIAKQNEDYARMKGEQEALQYGISAADRRGRIVAEQGGSGIRVDSGSSVDVRKSQDFVTAMDLTQIRSNAARKAYGHVIEQTEAKNQATGYRAAGRDAYEAGKLESRMSLLSTATSVAGKWYDGQQAGLWG